jgi:coatomer subunit beta'
LDRSIKVWSFSSPTPNFSLEGHERGVNCIDYYPGGDKPYIVSGADDHLLKIWDYQTRSCVTTLEGHSNNVCAVAFHAKLPVILSGSEDGTVRVWHNTTYRLESTLNYGLERAWAVSAASNSTKVALGFDEGTVVIKLGKESPVASMDKNGKIIMCVLQSSQQCNPCCYNSLIHSVQRSRRWRGCLVIPSCGPTTCGW